MDKIITPANVLNFASGLLSATLIIIEAVRFEFGAIALFFITIILTYYGGYFKGKEENEKS